MKKSLLAIFALALGSMLTASRANAQYGTSSGTTTISVTIGTMAGLTITNSSTPLTLSGTNPNQFTGTTNLTYYVRTSTSAGSGVINLKVSSDFSPSGGPSVASPISSSDALTYTCTVAGPGTACTGSNKASTTVGTNLARFGANAHTTSSGSTASVSWTLPNDLEYQTGTYTATITFTISAS